MPAFDPHYLDDICAGDDSLRSELLHIYCEQALESERVLQSAFDSNNLDALAKEAHKAKATALSMGMTDLADALKKIEVLCKKIIIRDFPNSVSSHYFEIYSKQLVALDPVLISWSDENLSLDCVQQMINFCKLRSQEGRSLAEALIADLQASMISDN